MSEPAPSQGTGAGVATDVKVYPGGYTWMSVADVPNYLYAHVGGTPVAVKVGSTMIPVTSPVGAIDKCVYPWWPTYSC